MQIFIEPSDVLLFRDGRPFSAGEGHRARSIFPPYPSTIQGVIRSKVLAERCGNYQLYRDGCFNCSKKINCTIPDEIGIPAKNGQGNYGAMHLKAALIAKYHNSELTTYLPVPADVVQIKNKSNSASESELRYLQPLQNHLPGVSDLSLSLLPLWTPETTPVEAAQGGVIKI
jgi:CRISPR-associated protein Cmr3